MNGKELQMLSFSTAGEEPLSIACRFREPEENKPVFVWFCGFKSEMASVKAEALSAWAEERGAGCLRFDYSGHGRSSGRFEDGTISAWTAQAAKAHELALPFGPAVFVGSSMGAWIALLLARRLLADGLPAPKGIVLIAPAWDMTRLMRERAPEEARAELVRNGVYYRPSAYSDDPYPITRMLIDDGEQHVFGKGPVPLASPIRILHGCRDADIPWRHSLDLLDVLACEDMRLTLIKDGEHRLSRPQDLDLLFSALAEFV